MNTLDDCSDELEVDTQVYVCASDDCSDELEVDLVLEITAIKLKSMWISTITAATSLKWMPKRMFVPPIIAALNLR